jgi:glycosyltransferase involved in cell wall biosynthesis
LLGILQRLDRSRFAPHVYLVAPGGDLRGEVPADVPVHVFRDRWRPPLWRYPGQEHFARIRDVAAVLREQRIDVVYDRTYHMTLTTAGAAARVPTPRISVIVTDPKQDFETNAERFRALKRALLTRAYHSADRVVAVSEGVRQAAIEQYRLPPEQVVTLYNFFDVQRIDDLMRQPLPPAEARQPGRFEVVAAGRLHPQKGFSYLLEAVRQLVQGRGRRELHLRILGTGPLEPELRGFIARHELAPYVTLAGFRQNPLPYFRQADLFCLSSLYEGMPNALVEAMLCGVPVLATDCPSGPREILEGGRWGRLVPPADAQALAAAIDDALDHSGETQGLAAAARAHIEKTFAPAAGIARLEELLTDVRR